MAPDTLKSKHTSSSVEGGIKPFIAQSVDATTLQQKETMLVVVHFLQNIIKNYLAFKICN